MLRIEIPLVDPSRLLRPIADMLTRLTEELVDDGVIAAGDQQKAADGMVAILPELMKFSLSLEDSERKRSAAVVIKLVNDAAAVTMMKQAGIDAVKLQRPDDA